APHAHPGEILDGKSKGAAVEKIDRLGRDRLYDRFNLLARLDARRIQTVGAGIGESLQAPDGVIEVGTAVQKVLAAGGEDDIAACFVDCGASRLDAIERLIEP